MKYIVMEIDGKEEIFLFPRNINHDRFHESITTLRFDIGPRDWDRKLAGEFPISAGFVDNFRCHGRSETLNLDSRGDKDTLLLRK